jgi:hypothetical protein
VRRDFRDHLLRNVGVDVGRRGRASEELFFRPPFFITGTNPSIVSAAAPDVSIVPPR